MTQLHDGPTVIDYALSDARLTIASTDAVMLSYRADFGRPGSAAGSRPEAMYVSSLWCYRDDNWVNTFSQDTPANERF